MGWFKAIGYISFVSEALALAALAKSLSPVQLAQRSADVLYKTLDYALGGRVVGRIDRQELNGAVGAVVKIIMDAVNGRN
jgi:hypothetical protein